VKIITNKGCADTEGFTVDDVYGTATSQLRPCHPEHYT